MRYNVGSVWIRKDGRDANDLPSRVVVTRVRLSSSGGRGGFGFVVHACREYGHHSVKMDHVKFETVYRHHCIESADDIDKLYT